MRIVSLSPSLTEVLIALEAQDRLVGVSDACPVDSLDPGRIGSPRAIQLSKMGALNPDWVLTDPQDNRPDQIQEIQRKWKTQIFDVKSLPGVRDAVADLGRLVDKQKEAQRLIEAIRKEMLTNEEVFRDRPKKRTVLLLWDQPCLSVNFDAYPSRLLEASGGVNVFREEPLREFPVEAEEMIEKNPEVLFLAGNPAPFRSKHMAHFRQYRIFSRIPIHLVPGLLLGRYGARTVEALKYLRKIYETVP